MYQPRPLDKTGGYDLRFREMSAEALQKYSSQHLAQVSPRQMKREMEEEMRKYAQHMDEDEKNEMHNAISDMKKMMDDMEAGSHPMKWQKLKEMKEQAIALWKEITSSDHRLVEGYDYMPLASGYYSGYSNPSYGYPRPRRWWNWRRYRNPYLWYGYRPWRYTYA